MTKWLDVNICALSLSHTSQYVACGDMTVAVLGPTPNPKAFNWINTFLWILNRHSLYPLLSKRWDLIVQTLEFTASQTLSNERLWTSCLQKAQECRLVLFAAVWHHFYKLQQTRTAEQPAAPPFCPNLLHTLSTCLQAARFTSAVSIMKGFLTLQSRTEYLHPGRFHMHTSYLKWQLMTCQSTYLH